MSATGLLHADRSDTTGHLGLAGGEIARQLKRPVAQAPPLDAYAGYGARAAALLVTGSATGLKVGRQPRAAGIRPHREDRTVRTGVVSRRPTRHWRRGSAVAAAMLLVWAEAVAHSIQIPTALLVV
jgi:hypothetical protein